MRELFDRLELYNLLMNPGKCYFGYYELKYLGHCVTRFGVKMDPEKTEAITNYPAPTSKSEIHSFLGLCSYYRRFVKGYSQIAAPLYDLLGKRVEFVWTQQQEEAFQKL